MSNQHRGEGAPSRSVPQGYGSGQRGYPRSPQPLPSDGRASGRDAPPRGHGAHIYEPPPTPAPPMGYGLPTNPPHSNQFWLPPSATTESYHVPEPSTPISRPQRGGLTSGAGVGQPQGGPRIRDTPQAPSNRNRNAPGIDNACSYPQSTGVGNTQEPIDLTGFIHEKGQWATRTSGFADVWKCVLYRGNDGTRREQVAVKSIRLPVTDHSEHIIGRITDRFRNQIHMWVKLPPHKRILPIYGMANNFGPLPSLVSPWAENGTLNYYLERQTASLPFSRKITLIYQISLGLLYLHDNGICHGNLTGSNVLIDRNGDALISDFGLSAIFAEFNYTTYFSSYKPSAVRWIDPQLIVALVRPENDRVSTKAELIHDIYSLGCMMLQLLTGLVPYHDKHDVAVSAMKLNAEDPVIPTTLSPLVLSNLIKRCWDKNHYARPILKVIIATVQQAFSNRMTT